MLYILLESNGMGFNSQLPFIIVIIAVTYFFFLRPSAKKTKEQNAFVESLEKGKEVVTSSGIIGKISKISDKEITLQVSEKTFIRMTLGSVSNELTSAFHKSNESSEKSNK